MCAHAVRVALKDIPGVNEVQVSLSKGDAAVTFAPGNTVRYEQLQRAIEKNGFVLKGATLVADGTVVSSGAGYELQVSGSGDHLRLEAGSAASLAALAGKSAEVTGDVPELRKGERPDVLRYTSGVAK